MIKSMKARVERLESKAPQPDMGPDEIAFVGVHRNENGELVEGERVVVWRKKPANTGHEKH